MCTWVRVEVVVGNMTVDKVVDNTWSQVVGSTRMGGEQVVDVEVAWSQVVVPTRVGGEQVVDVEVVDNTLVQMVDGDLGVVSWVTRTMMWVAREMVWVARTYR